MKRILKPFKGLNDIDFGTPLKKLQEMVNIHTSEVTNKFLKESKVYGDKINYVFNNDILVTFELPYQEEVFFNDTDIFNVKDIEAFLKGFQYETKKEHVHCKELGMILLSFKKKDIKKRELWLYSKEMLDEFDTFLDVA